MVAAGHEENDWIWPTMRRECGMGRRDREMEETLRGAMAGDVGQRGEKP